ncbi:thiamine-phosphate kinase [bacterium]|nr:thiamine-phosphate kinase [bacterium]
MKEKEFINIIKNTLNSDYIGDDCACLRDLGIVVTQDSLVEGVHFSLDFTTPYKLGWKSAMVNISDVCASGAEPKYLTVALSLPKNIGEDFVEEFYQGLKDACGEVQVVGGDITGSDKIFISVTAIGKTEGRKISSRKNANIGQKIIVSGGHGASGAGLKLLLGGKNEPSGLINSHLMPVAQRDFSLIVSTRQKNDYAMMDTSDGLADALSQIAESSCVNLEVDFSKIPYNKELESFDDLEDLVLLGGEDYQLVATVDEEVAKDFIIIGEVKSGSGVTILKQDKKIQLSKQDVEEKLFNHF